jgi:hypothetical protein
MKQHVAIIFIALISLCSCRKFTWDNPYDTTNPSSEPPSLKNGLVAYYPFNGNADDESGNSNHGAVNGAMLASDRFGNLNSAYLFNGSSNFITVPYNQIFDLPNSFTLSVWINTTNVNLGQRIIDRSTGGTSNDWLVDLSPNPTDLKKIRCIAGGAVTNLPYSNPSITQNNTWNLVTITYDRQNIKFYINGNIDNVLPLVTATPTSKNIVRIGASTSGGAGFFSGKLDDIRIYNRALTQDEITYLANN